MKLDELEKMAQQTAAYGVHPSGEFIYSFYTEQLQAFAKLIADLIASAEREACIDLVAMYGGPVDLEAAIRARGNVATNDTSQERVAKTSKSVHEAQRTWVGLTDEEIQYCVELKNPEAIAEEVEAKLKEKNNG